MAALKGATPRDWPASREDAAASPTARRPLEVVFICQAADRDDPVLASTVGWIEALAGRPGVGRVKVLALRVGEVRAPAKAEIRRFGRSNRVATLAAFYREAARSLRRRPDLFFVYQGGPYPLLLLPFKVLARVPIVQWKAHPAIGRMMRIYARWCDDLIFTSTPTAFPMDLPKVRVVGQGIDTQVFRSDDQAPAGDLIATCRISPRKRVAEMVEAVVRANREHGGGYRLDVYGPTLPGDEAYADRVHRLIEDLQASDWVALHGSVSHAELPALLNRHRAFLNLGETALDRSVVEAMACGLPVISSNASVLDVMPADLRPRLITDKQSTERQAATIHDVLSLDRSDLEALGRRMRALVVAEHSIGRLFDRILEEVEASLWDRD